MKARRRLNALGQVLLVLRIAILTVFDHRRVARS